MRVNLHFKNKSAGGEKVVEHSPKLLASEENATTATGPVPPLVAYWVFQPKIVDIPSSGFVPAS